jgi:hypothetical protein
MNNKPQTDDAWIILANNIHGFFFESLCRKHIADTNGWKIVSTNYPVSYPAPNGPFKGNESNLDIRAESYVGNTRLTLLAECKKRNLELVNWIFFPRNPYSIRDYSHSLNIIDNQLKSEPETGWKSQTSIITQNSTDAIVTEEARETRASYMNFKGKDETKTKTANDRITDAAYQVALATQAIIGEEAFYSEKMAAYSPTKLPYGRQSFIPLIITNAQLFLCTYDPTDIDVITGEIPLDKAKLSNCPYLIYEYPLPKHLQKGPQDLALAIANNNLELFTRLHIFVVNIQTLSSFLASLIGS